MLFSLISDGEYLTAAIIIVSILWLYVFIKSMMLSKKNENTFEMQYQRILNSDEYKVKGRFEE